MEEESISIRKGENLERLFDRNFNKLSKPIKSREDSFDGVNIITEYKPARK
jgi:hypothetical protein